VKKHWYCGKSALVLSWSFDVNSQKKRQDLLVLRLFQHPLLVLVDVPGFYQERIKSGMGLSFMVPNYYMLKRSYVPRITVITRAYGGAYDDELKTHWCRHELCMANCRNCRDGSQRSFRNYLKNEINKAKILRLNFRKEAEYAKLFAILILQPKEVLR
jgi:hypothetical protein